jgi:ABC-2 type transport system ATP-binding protein
MQVMVDDNAPVVLTNVTKRFGSTTAVDSVSWSPRPGQVTALVGLNGAGKSTLMRLVTGLVKPTDGEVSTTDVAGGRALSAMIEVPALFRGLSARRNLQIHGTLVGADADDIARVAALAQIDDVLPRRAGTLSQGYRQRVAIAIALLGRPRTLLLDEPMNSLDPEAVIQLRRLIRQVADEGTALVVSSHQLRELEGTADALTLLHEGRIRYNGPFDSFIGPPTLRVRATDADSNRGLLKLLQGAQIHGELEPAGIRVTGNGDNTDTIAHRIFTTAADAGIGLVELSHITPTLEEAFHTAIAGVES